MANFYNVIVEILENLDLGNIGRMTTHILLTIHIFINPANTLEEITSI